MPPVNRCIVAFMTGDGSSIRQLSDFKTAEIREEFENFLLSMGAHMFGDWYNLPNGVDVNAGITKTWQLGGQCYDLPYRPHGEGIFAYLVRLLLGELLTSLLSSLKPLQ